MCVWGTTDLISVQTGIDKALSFDTTFVVTRIETGSPRIYKSLKI